ncbi:MAG: YkgJ family cysteine cluster protein [Humidesulfovibrio sp.]|nr:YkgJ family cysteine cluster protein [Humidesulfovibrio sp.]
MDTETKNTATCRRCGECCRKGGPALHTQDKGLFTGKNAVDLSQVVTLRAGEPAFDQVRGRVAPLPGELLKLKGANQDWTCVFFNAGENACGLYDRRPAECRALFCQDTTELAAMYEQDRLTRRDLLPRGHGVLAVMAEHEALVPPARIAALAEALRAGGAEAQDAEFELTRMALADRAFRQSLTERAGIAAEYHEFFFGRGAEALFAATGLCLRADVRRGVRVQPDPFWRV